MKRKGLFDSGEFGEKLRAFRNSLKTRRTEFGFNRIVQKFNHPEFGWFYLEAHSTLLKPSNPRPVGGEISVFWSSSEIDISRFEVNGNGALFREATKLGDVKMWFRGEKEVSVPHLYGALGTFYPRVRELLVESILQR